MTSVPTASQLASLRNGSMAPFVLGVRSLNTILEQGIQNETGPRVRWSPVYFSAADLLLDFGSFLWWCGGWRCVTFDEFKTNMFLFVQINIDPPARH